MTDFEMTPEPDSVVMTAIEARQLEQQAAEREDIWLDLDEVWQSWPSLGVRIEQGRVLLPVEGIEPVEKLSLFRVLQGHVILDEGDRLASVRYSSLTFEETRKRLGLSKVVGAVLDWGKWLERN